MCDDSYIEANTDLNNIMVEGSYGNSNKCSESMVRKDCLLKLHREAEYANHICSNGLHFNLISMAVSL